MGEVKREASLPVYNWNLRLKKSKPQWWREIIPINKTVKLSGKGQVHGTIDRLIWKEKHAHAFRVYLPGALTTFTNPVTQREINRYSIFCCRCRAGACPHTPQLAFHRVITGQIAGLCPLSMSWILVERKECLSLTTSVAVAVYCSYKHLGGYLSS